jgi:hypothetical protein
MGENPTAVTDIIIRIDAKGKGKITYQTAKSLAVAGTAMG